MRFWHAPGFIPAECPKAHVALIWTDTYRHVALIWGTPNED